LREWSHEQDHIEQIFRGSSQTRRASGAGTSRRVSIAVGGGKIDCKVLQVAPSAYRRHAARRRDPSLRSQRGQRDEQLLIRPANRFMRYSRHHRINPIKLTYLFMDPIYNGRYATGLAGESRRVWGGQDMAATESRGHFCCVLHGPAADADSGATGRAQRQTGAHDHRRSNGLRKTRGGSPGCCVRY